MSELVAEPLQDTPPRILLLGPVEILDATDGLVEPTRRKRLTELAAILAMHPGCDHTILDACFYPGERVGDNTRNTQMSKLRRWLGTTTTGEDFLPRYEAGAGYRLHPAVTTDWDTWQKLLPTGPRPADTKALDAALQLVRGRPFDGVRARRYAWAEPLKQRMISEIGTAAYELARRRIRAGQWRAAESTVVLGLSIEPGLERLWRLRILAAHGAGDEYAVREAVARLRIIASDLDSSLEPATRRLLAGLDLEHPRR